MSDEVNHHERLPNIVKTTSAQLKNVSINEKQECSIEVTSEKMLVNWESIPFVVSLLNLFTIRPCCSLRN